MVDPIALVLGSALATGLLGALAWRRFAAKLALSAEEQRNAAQQLEKQLHLRERDFLAEKNQLESDRYDSIRTARSAAFEEGRQLGLNERNATHINDLSTQRSTMRASFEAERDQAVTEAREKLRAEYELQAKLFSVKISPYVSVREDKGLLRNSYETCAGYQYQLLVNGIPAFAPHVIAEQTEVKKEINPEVERLLVQTAERAATAAIDLYLGGSIQFAKRTEPIFKRLPKLG